MGYTSIMEYAPTIHKRRSIRLKGYDYSSKGAYFITICTHRHLSIFGDIIDGEMQLNAAGKRVQSCWKEIPDHFPHVSLDAFVVMPNHVHGILFISKDVVVGAKNFSPLQSATQPRGTSKTIGSVIRGFKIGVTQWVRQNTSIKNVWQRNYWEHIIRSEPELKGLREYIRNNPARWTLDRLYRSP
jgi:putative transposase